MPVPLIINGAAGRMGGRIIALALERPQEFRVVAGVDQKAGTLRALGHASDAPVHDQLPNERGAVVIDFSHHTAFYGLAQKCGAAGMPLVSGTTGIPPVQLEDGLAAAAKSVAAIHAMNYSVGVNVVFQVAAQIAKTLGLDYDIEVVEAHHNQKKDAPSGTALQLQAGMERAGYARRIDMSSARVGSIPGTHEVGFDGPSDTITLTHTVRDRAVFARGALEAARWLVGKHGWFTMRDLLAED